MLRFPALPKLMSHTPALENTILDMDDLLLWFPPEGKRAIQPASTATGVIHSIYFCFYCCYYYCCKQIRFLRLPS